MKILVVDDEPSVRRLLQRYLGGHGHEVTIAASGAEGWAAACDGEPDLILSDVSMPGMDGYELVRTLRRHPATASIPVILLSANRGADDMVEGYRSGADDYVAKPVDVEVLRHKIDALLRRAQPEPVAPPPALGRLVCVTSAKGGAGVTTVAANLAVLLGRRTPSQRVCAVDLDLAHGDLQVLFDLRPPAGIAEAARELLSRDGDGELVPVQWDDYVIRHEGGPWLLAAPQTPLEASAVSDPGVTQVLAGLRTSYDHLVVDLPPSYGELALSVYEAAERLVVLISPEITALRRTRELLGVLESLKVGDERVLLVLNEIVDKGSVDRARVEGFLRRPVNAVIPFGGRAFLEAVTTGRPVVTSQKSKPVDALTELAAALL